MNCADPKEDTLYLVPLWPGRTANDARLIAGPCSAETKEQTFRVAEELANQGVTFFRAGVWKPRTRPGSFEGVGARGLKWLRRIESDLGMVALTEIATPAHLNAALRAGLRNFWIGARTVTNPFAVQQLADAFSALSPALRESVSLLVKNPVSPDIELWIGAFQRFNAAGLRRLGAVHRGFSTYGAAVYRNEPQWAIPIELKRRYPELPLYCDPSHIAGDSRLVPEVARRAGCLGFDGLMVESHCCPAEAWSDAGQQIEPSEAVALLKESVYKEGSCGDNHLLTELRALIDEADGELVGLMARRMEVARRIGRLKLDEGLPIIQPERYRDLMEHRVSEGASLGLSARFMRKLMALIHEESVEQQMAVGNTTEETRICKKDPEKSDDDGKG